MGLVAPEELVEGGRGGWGRLDGGDGGGAGGAELGGGGAGAEGDALAGLGVGLAARVDDADVAFVDADHDGGCEGGSDGAADPCLLRQAHVEYLHAEAGPAHDD